MLAGLAARPGAGVLAGSTLLPLLLAVALTLLIDGAILSTVWRCVQGRGQGRPLRRSRRTAGQATSGAALGAAHEVVSRRFADAVARGDFAEAEAEAARFLEMPLG